MNASSLSALWIRRFLEAMGAERDAAQNTLAAYGRDLTDYATFLADRGRDAASAERADIEAYMQDAALRGLRVRRSPGGSRRSASSTAPPSSNPGAAMIRRPSSRARRRSGASRRA